MQTVTKEKVLEIFSVISGEDEVKPGMTIEDLGIDSLEAVEVIMAIEEAQDMPIPDEDSLEHFTQDATVEDVIKYVLSRNPQ